ncbi:hypothetical protein AB1Y20_023725 [Prymnesium parvum]|uniref:Uncharacterized protein n=1 Tax=Prymnesium parvum TaxID=97485 RepID=A0AB34JH69_PRYPA
METLNDAENAALGASVAVLEGVLLQPTLYWKNAMQQALPFTIDPRKLYRGLFASLLNEAGQMSIQFGITGGVKRRVRSDGASEPRWLSLAAASAGGMAAALFASPVELVMIQQQRSGESAHTTLRAVTHAHGVGARGLCRGLGPAVLRDAVYVGGMLGLTPLVQAMLAERYEASAGVAGFWASVVGGVAGGVLSHPFDVVKTCMQGDLGCARYGSFTATTARLLAEGGFARLLHGVTWRTINITATVYIANECCCKLPPYIRRLTRGEGS